MYKERIERDHILQNQKKNIEEAGKNSGVEQFLQGMVQLVSGVEDYVSPFHREDGLAHPNPEILVEEISKSAAWKAGSISATCSLPGGALGFLTLLPELIMIFRVQGYLIKDIATIYGKEAQLSRELLLFCLFKHGGAQLFRKFIEETGVKILIRPTTVRAFQAMLQKVGLDFTRRVLRKNMTRWVPLAGAAITGSFAYFDTKAIGKNAQQVFSKEIILLESPIENPLLEVDNNPEDSNTMSNFSDEEEK
jgi:hypothetical protein